MGLCSSKMAAQYGAMKARRSEKKALFVVSSTAQAEMFSSISKQLLNWDILAININKWFKREEIEKALERVGLPFKTIGSCRERATNQILKEEQPDVVVFGNDMNPMDKLIIRSASSFGIPTLLVQDGILVANTDVTDMSNNAKSRLNYWASIPPRIFGLIRSKQYSLGGKAVVVFLEWKYGTREKPEIYGCGDCSKIAVFGEAVKDIFISRGIDTARIVVTGNPKFDQLLDCKPHDQKQNIITRLGIPPDKEIILLVTQPFVEGRIWNSSQRKEFIVSIVDATAALPNAQLIIKLHHPQESEQDYFEIIRDITQRPIICSNVPINELLKACSLVLVTSSTVALEAMAIGKPVVVVNVFKNRDAAFFSESGALFAEEKEDILSVMRKALYEYQEGNEMTKARDRFVYRQAYLQDGQASKRIADLIMSMH